MNGAMNTDVLGISGLGFDPDDAGDVEARK